MSDCIIWAKAKNEKGYGRMLYKGKLRYAHRVHYCIANNVDIESIDGLQVRHSCDNPSCINPDHLSIGTSHDNHMDMKNRGRSTAGEKHGCVKITEQQAIEIKERYKAYCKTNGMRALAREFGISEDQILNIASGRRWGHLE